MGSDEQGSSTSSAERACFVGSIGNTLVGDWRGDPGDPGVLFLHGGGQTRHSWGGSAESIARLGFRTLSLDHRGHGESDWAENKSYALRDLAADTKLICEQFPSPPAIIGASLGGMTAMALEGDFAPGSASAIVLVDVIPDLEDDGVERIKSFMSDRLVEGFASLDEAAEAVAAYNPHRTRPVDPEGLRKNLRLGDDRRWRWHWDPAFMQPAFENPELSKYGATDYLMDAVASIDVPMQLIRGRLSDIVSEDGARSFIERFPHIDYVDVSDASHMVAGDRNDIFTEAVATFLIG